MQPTQDFWENCKDLVKDYQPKPWRLILELTKPIAATIDIVNS